MLGQLAVSDDNYMSLMLNNAKSYWWYGHVDSFQAITQKVNAVTNEDIKKVAKQILSPKNTNVLIYR